MSQRGGKKGRRSDRTSVRGGKPPAGVGVSHLLSHSSESVYNNPPLAHTLVSLIGCVVEVQLYSGEVYEGILRAISPNMEISLNVAHVKGQPTTMDSIHSRYDVKFSEVVTISAKTTGNNPQLDIFKTDTEISSHHSNGPQSRELQPFTDFKEDADGIMGNSEEDSGWSVEEMWAVNKDKFQVSSTYDDELPQYTTPLSRDGENYRKRELEAIQLANEIESKNMYVRHGVDDTGTEEDRWSSVVRETERLELPGKCPETDVKENGSHIVTSSHITPHTQAPPTSTPPNIAPPPVTSSPSASPISSDTDQGSTHCLLPPAPPTPCQLLGNSQIESPDNVVGGDNREPDEGDTPVISDERARDPCVTVGESTLAEEEHSTAVDEVASDQPTPAPSLDGDGRGETESKEDHTNDSSVPAVQETAAEKEQAIKNFKLDPTAKEFFFPGASSASSFLPPLSSATSSIGGAAASVQGLPSTTHHTHTHTRAHTHTTRSGGTRYPGNHSPRLRAQTPTSGGYSPAALFPTHDAVLPTAAVSSAYMLTQQPGSAMTGLIRPSNLVQQGFSQYGNPLMAMPQILAANPHTQMIAGVGAGQQPFSLGGVMQQPPLFPAGQTIVTPQGVMMPAAAAQPMYIPLSPQMTVGVPPVNPAAVGQALVGTTAASGFQRPYQLQGGTK